uniref:Uncharacterized protein n=1 Tax=Parascaris equorum TaxID=6256 RepID=A0A914S4R1_PAREQ
MATHTSPIRAGVHKGRIYSQVFHVRFRSNSYSTLLRLM